MRKAPIMYSGIMTCYLCNASCRHCMYCSGPEAGDNYVTPDMAGRICELLAGAGVKRMHIGGGEPFLKFGSLLSLIDIMVRSGIEVDYIETNAYWYNDETSARERLREIRRFGADTVMVSVDPFHIEYVPLERPLKLVGLLDELGMNYFIWQEKYIKRLLKLDIREKHGRDELGKVLGEDYAQRAAGEYGLGVNGRALILARSMLRAQPVSELLSGAPCDVMSGRHCHVDNYGNFVPPGCPGIAIELGDYFSGNIPEEKYPVAARLMSGGVAKLYEYAGSLGFQPDDNGYISKCELCYFIRSWLKGNFPSKDLAPDCFYKMMGKAYNE